MERSFWETRHFFPKFGELPHDTIFFSCDDDDDDDDRRPERRREKERDY
jgi:hypothetical protein